jgi:hypothetical protein
MTIKATLFQLAIATAMWMIADLICIGPGLLTLGWFREIYLVMCGMTIGMLIAEDWKEKP